MKILPQHTLLALSEALAENMALDRSKVERSVIILMQRKTK